jgi:hypothetical protein
VSDEFFYHCAQAPVGLCAIVVIRVNGELGSWQQLCFHDINNNCCGFREGCKENLLEINGPINLLCIVACRNINRKNRKIYSYTKNIKLKILYKPCINTDISSLFENVYLTLESGSS